MKFLLRAGYSSLSDGVSFKIPHGLHATCLSIVSQHDLNFLSLVSSLILSKL